MPSATPIPPPGNLSDRFLAAGLDLAPDTVLVACADGRILYANPAACLLLGYAREEFLTLGLAEIQPDFSWSDWKAPSLETLFLAKNGSRIPVELTRAKVAREDKECLFLYVRDITGRKAAEAALRKTEARYALAFNASPDAINLTRLEDGTYLEVSTGFERLTGWKREETLGRTSLELDLWATPADRQKMTALLKEKGEFDASLFTFRCKNGALIKGLMSGRLVSLEGVPCLLTITRDVTLLLDAQRALGNLSDLISAITANVPAFITLLDLEGRILFINRMAPGYRLEDVIGMDFRDGMAEEVRDLASLALARILAGAEREGYEGWGWGSEREMRWYRCIMGPMTEDGLIKGAVLIALDETERRLQEERLRESEDRFQAFQLHTPDALFWIQVTPSGDMVLEGMNPAAESMVGCSATKVKGHTLQSFCPPPMAEMFIAHNRKCIEARRPVVLEEVLPGPAGPVHLSTTLVPIEDETGRVYRIVGSARDITQDVHMAEAVRQTQKLESLGVLAGGIAHDFNNLLTAIMGNLNLAQLKLPETSPVHTHLEAVENTVLKASELTRQMLAYSGKGRFSVKTQDLNAVVEEMAHLLEVTVPKTAVLRILPGQGLPPIEGDAAQLQQVIMNLVTNASDSLGGREGVIRVATGLEVLDAGRLRSEFPAQAMDPGPFVVLEVEDTGCGMSQDILARIFDPFFTTKVKGRGLGLSAMRGILKGHRAGLAIHSVEGVGSRFRVFFPASAKALRTPVEKSHDPAAFEGKVLLVDDEAVILDSIGHALEAMGFEVLKARDGVEAMEIFEAETSLALVLMDLTMPRMDGATAFAKMHAQRPLVPVVLSSGYDRQALEGLRPAAFVQKPYRLKELRALLQEVLAGAG